ncbi:J domain-containing protein [Sulfuricystis multivorans]|uniref:J domain-containing protein n=1 Tax=Sulfuricystis multivorans TaxID=2211108 RepID=UPI000F81C720|nr:J domain-containing protein [Sulfuricystis multivorans]
MNRMSEISSTLAAWLKLLGQASAGVRAPSFANAAAPEQQEILIGALAALAAEALACDRSLTIVTADDGLLPDISNALDLHLRPLCLVLPGADHARPIALRATLSLLKSRLSRTAADSQGPVWTAQRERLRHADALWRMSLAWVARNLRDEAPPAGIFALFPVRIAPWQAIQHTAMPTDWVVLMQDGRLPAQLCSPWPGARHTLLLSWAGGKTQGIVLTDETAQLSAQIELLGQELAELELELATAQGELAAFGARYQMLVAARIVRLDRLLAELAAARLECTPQDAAKVQAAQEARARADQSQREYEAGRCRPEGEQTQSFAPDIELKKRFRQLAQKIHPDRAANEAERAWRTQLMSEANRAYRAGDAVALERIFALWRAGPGAAAGVAVPKPPSFARRQGLIAQRDAIRQRIAAIGAELDRLYGSKLYELFAAARLAERQGRDLLSEMAQRLDRQIAQAESELAALIKG